MPRALNALSPQTKNNTGNQAELRSAIAYLLRARFHRPQPRNLKLSINSPTIKFVFGEGDLGALLTRVLLTDALFQAHPPKARSASNACAYLKLRH
jgi:hypothetical protein